jgi:hypothetical protein
MRIEFSTTIEKQAFWQQHMNGWESSAKSQATYCLEQGISFFAFGYWRKRLKQSSESIKFIKATGDCHSKKSVTPILQVLLPNGVRIGVSHEARVETVREILSSLGAL